MHYIESFKKSVKKNANKIAIVHGEKKISYKELDILSSKVAHKLHKMGAKKGDFIAINLPRSINYVASYLGILKAGLAVVPLSAKYPRERVNFILKECAAFLEIKSEFFADIDEFEFFENLAADDDPALLVYTSGSTGVPKGILHTNKDLSSSILRAAKALISFENTIFASITQFSFVTFFVDFFCGFCFGNEIHIVPDEVRISPELLNEYYKKHKIQTGMLPPALLRLFSKKPALKAIHTGSEKMSSYFKGLEIHNFYGMSETLVPLSSFKVDKKYDNAPIGKGFKDAEILVFDENNKECETGQIGQLVIKGDFGQKYFNDPQRTKKTFVKNGAKTLIFTGDMGLKNENGDIIITGRKDWMVKIHGQRVEIYEIESLLNKIKNVKECAIKAFGDADKYLVGFVVGKDLNAEFLRNELAKKLPSYMIPKYFVFIDALPKNINGKLDRKALKEVEFSGQQKDFTPPKNKDEIELCKIFASVLGIEKVGLDDDFTLLGGDSLSASKIASISKLKGINPSLILKEKTPKNIIKACKKLKKLDNKNEKSKLNPTQLYMYYAYDPKRSFYYLPFYTKLPNDVDLKRFKKAVNSAFLSHKILSSRIKNKNSKLYFVYKKEKLKIEFEKIQNLQNFIKEFIKPFNLEKDRLYNFCLCECQNGDKYFVLNIHHVIFDGVSLEVFMNDIADFYSGKKRKIKPESYVFSLNYNKLLENRMKDDFAHKIANKDYAPKADINNANYSEFLVKDKLKNGKKILKFLAKNKLTPDSFFISIYALSLFEISKYNECELLYSSTSRFHKDLKNSVGMFVESFPIHFDKTSFKDLCATKNLYVAHSTFLSSLDVSNIKIGYVYEDELDSIGVDFEGDKLKMILIDRELKRTKIFLTICKDKTTFYYYLHYNRNIYSKKFIQKFCNLYQKIIDEFLEGKRNLENSRSVYER